MAHRLRSGHRLLAGLTILLLLGVVGAGTAIRYAVTTPAFGLVPTAAPASEIGSAPAEGPGSAVPPQPIGGALGVGDSGVTSGPTTGGELGTATVSNGSSASALTDETLVVKTGSLSLEVSGIDVALTKARAIVTGLGGYVGASQQSNEGEQKVAMVTYRIPAAHWDAAVDGLRALGNRVVNEQTGAVEVTGQVLDLGARIDNLRATEQALQVIMARAVKISDVLDVQQQLTDVRGQIEQLATEKAHLEQQAAYGSLTTTYTVPVVAVAAQAKGWDPRAEIDLAAAQLMSMAQAVATAGIWFLIVVLPLLLLGAIVLVPIAWLLRRIAARSRPQGPLWGAPPAAPGSTNAEA
jgi:hypothetical protein